MWKVSKVESDGSGQEISRPVAWRERDTPPVCCEKPMEPRLARAHDRLGGTLFVAVWQCPACRRITD